MMDEVLETLKKNRTEHEEIVEEAQEGFRRIATEKLEQALADAKAGKKIQTSISLSVPESYLEEYDNAIELLEATQRAGTDKVELDADEFQRFMRNRWHWSGKFAHSNALYSEKARTATGMV